MHGAAILMCELEVIKVPPGLISTLVGVSNDIENPISEL